MIEFKTAHYVRLSPHGVAAVTVAFTPESSAENSGA